MIDIKSLASSEADFDQSLNVLLADIAESDPEVERRVGAIIAEVRARGDAALVEFTNRLDRRRVRAGDLEIDRGRIQAAARQLSTDLRAGLETAARRIQDFHARQKGIRGRSKTKPACCSARKSRRWIVQGYTCRGAGRPIPRRCS